ncbi:ABC transporter ATP-binding protein, partial [Nonomuraea sp. RK-328]|nr:ABC transporter ATP-binding protein [Nonomuraea sp. RK-328]
MTDMAVEFTHVTAGYRNGAATVHDLTFTLPRGGSLGVVGESGSGKTTLARLVVGLLQPTSGQVRILGGEWSKADWKGERRRRVQMVFQDPYGSLNPQLTALDTVADVVGRWSQVSKPEAQDKARDLLLSLGLSTVHIGKRPGSLSGGQCQRVGIARAIASDPDILVADEPTSSLDVSVQAQILELMNALVADRGLSLIIITHDLAVMKRMAVESLVLKDGRIVEAGPASGILSSPEHSYTRRLVAAIPGCGRSIGPGRGRRPDGENRARVTPQQ